MTERPHTPLTPQERQDLIKRLESRLGDDRIGPTLKAKVARSLELLKALDAWKRRNANDRNVQDSGL